MRLRPFINSNERFIFCKDEDYAINHHIIYGIKFGVENKLTSIELMQVCILYYTYYQTYKIDE